MEDKRLWKIYFNENCNKNLMRYLNIISNNEIYGKFTGNNFDAGKINRIRYYSREFAISEEMGIQNFLKEIKKKFSGFNVEINENENIIFLTLEE